jgi:asparagine synthase (glutamine-hydrolysing)
MCGIVGLIDSRSKVDAETIRLAARTLYKRGPDDSGVWTSENVGLGHRRLAVLDLSSSGRQPMSSADGRYIIVFNGEIYNFMDIRRRIDRDDKNHSNLNENKSDTRWRSQSDSEVILEAYGKWGPNCLEQFHGMFAFAIWDREAKVLFAARDRMGVKPFYYHHSAGSFAFASRPRALLTLNPSWSSPLDEQALRFYLECGYVPAPYSIYQSIRKLPPAHWLLMGREGLRVERYWDFRQIPTEPAWVDRQEDDLLDELDEIVGRTVRSRMISDVPLGAFLSGGIDSSVVVALMAKHSNRRVQTFTVGFREKAFDESPHAQAVAQHIGTDHHCQHLQLNDLLDLLPEFSAEYDEPFFDSSAFPTMAVSRAARRHVTVALTGDGGDELFGGYRHYQIVRGLAPLYRLPAAARKLLALILAIVPSHRWKLLSGALGHSTLAEVFYFSRSISKDFGEVLRPDILRRTLGVKDLFAKASEGFPSGLTAPEAAMRVDAFYTLPDDYLQKVDVAGMAFSLECREPLLDQDLVEWAMKLPLKWKVRRGKNKYLLGKLACRYIPRHILDRPKMGFEVPIGEWLRGPLRGWAESEFSNKELFQQIPLDQKRLLALAALHNSGKRNVHPLLWSALVLCDFAKRKSPQPYAPTAAVL